MSDLIREDFEKWYVDKWYEWRLHQGYDPVSKQEMLQNIVLMRCEEKYENGKDYLNHAWEGWQAAIASMQGEAIGFFGGHRHYPQGTSEFFGWVYDADLRIEKGTKLFTYPPSAASKTAEQDARIKELEQQLEEARKVPVGYALVPIEPTESMRKAFRDKCAEKDGLYSDSPRVLYKTMLSAAPDAAIRQIGGAE